MAKEIVCGREAREKILEGIRRTADAVRVTFGPVGRNVLLEKAGGEPPLVTNDGLSIVKEISLKDPAENLGAEILQEIASKTNELAGDGTTTSVLLAQAIITEGLKNEAAGASPVSLRRGIQGAAERAQEAIRQMARKVGTSEKIARVAAVSSGDREIGELIAEALERVGGEGVVNIEESKSVETALEVTEGIVLDRGFLSPHMATDAEETAADLENPCIFITDYKLNSVQEIIPVLETAAMAERPLLIIAEEVGEQVLNLILRNKIEGDMDIVAIHPPAYGEGRKWRMEDLAVQTGGVFVTAETGCSVRDVTEDMLGSAGRALVKRKETVILDGGGDPEEIRRRENQLRRLIEKTDYEFNKKRYQERLANFVSGVAVIRIGAYSETELKERKLRAEDALHAARAAAESGIVPGGGAAYLAAVPAVEAYMETLQGDERTGASIVKKALEEPARQLAWNVGLEGSETVEAVRRAPAGTGFDVLQGSCRDMLEAGIADSVRAVCSALQSAASAAAVLLTTEAGVTEKEK